MALVSYPFDGQTVSETDYSRLFGELQDSGVAASADSQALKVTADGSGMRVFVRPGFAILRGHAVHSPEVITLPIAAPQSAERRDRVVLRLDPAANSIALDVLPGIPGGEALDPTQTEEGVFELSLGLVRVNPGVTVITSGSVIEGRRYTGTRVGNWTTNTRPAVPRQGHLGYNRTLMGWEFWDGAAWVNLAPSVAWANITGKPTTLPPSEHVHDWPSITNKPDAFPPASHAHDWSSVSGKPTTFPPSTHAHTWSSVTGKPATFPPAPHSHDYLTSGETIAWANGSKRPHNNAASGGGTWYAVWVEGDGTFCRNTSSIRFKKNVRDVEVNPDGVLSLRPVVYDRKDTVNEDGSAKEGRTDEVGLIAEEVEAAGLDWLVTYLDGEVDGLRYDLLGVALLPVVQHQATTIRALTERLEALEATLS
ncbi:tail fiber domain-containing protein [Streptomyces sp. NPDC005963]|uniref:tail fiber domain-containing protein n=1 Tax=Streptomyces sp. NPDC005963 TaxID=3156721 RepID=UPI0033C21DE9